MHGQNYEAQTSSEVIEFARNFAEIMCFIHTLIQPDKSVLLLDCPGDDCWRHEIYHRYYIQDRNFKVFQNAGDDEADGFKYHVTVDGATHLILWSQEMTRYISKKLVKAAVVELQADESWWEVPLKDLEENVKEAVDALLPGYKKGRKVGRWDFETPKTEFKALAAKLAPNFAPLVDGVAIGCDRAEADDLAYAFCRWLDAQEGDNEVVFVTTDSDWQQLGITRDNVSFYNPATHDFVDKTANQMQEAFWVKLLGGDRSDSIPGVMLANGTTKIAETRAAKVVEATGLGGMMDYIKAEIDPAALKRNTDLISLKRIPYALVQQCFDKINGAKPAEAKYKWIDFHLDEAAYNLAVADAQRDRIRLASAAEVFHKEVKRAAEETKL